MLFGQLAGYAVRNPNTSLFFFVQIAVLVASPKRIQTFSATVEELLFMLNKTVHFEPFKIGTFMNSININYI